MAIFHFPQFENELFCWCFKRLNAFLAQCGYCVGKWKILGIIDEGVNNETQILLQFWDFHGRTVDEAWSLLEWVAWDSFLSLIRLVVFVDIIFPILMPFMLDRTMLLFGVICVILLPITLVLALLCIQYSFWLVFTFNSVHGAWDGWAFWVSC